MTGHIFTSIAPVLIIYFKKIFDKLFYTGPTSLGDYFIQNGKNIIFNKPVNGEIVVFYDYLADTIRFRLIIRKNIPDTVYSGSADIIILKAKTKNYDPYYDKLTKVISSN